MLKFKNMNSQKYYLEKRNSFLDAKERDLKEYSKDELDKMGIKNIHFTAVCGKAMASLAGMLVEAGYNITGSDSECYPPMSDVVAESGVCYFDGFKKENIENADLVIVGNACPVSNIEAEYARLLGKPQLSVASALNYFCITDKKSIVVTGTHGKTTTTSYLAEMMNYLEEGTSYLVGGVLRQTGKSYSFDKNSKYIVIEGDEYDSAYFDKRPKFFHYEPYVLIITSIEFDHADIFKDFEEYKLAFKMLLNEKKKEGVVVACVDDVEVKNLVTGYSGELITYGIENDFAKLNAKNIKAVDGFQNFDVFSDGEFYANLEIPLFGNHNIRNALSVLGTLKFLGFSKEEIVSKMKDFSGVKQRQEILSTKSNITVVDDYAHHPTAVKETLFGLKNQYPESRIVAVFEPRSTTSRKKMYEDDYAKSFEFTDVVLIKDPNIRTQDNPEDILSTQNICDYLKSQKKEAFSIKTTDEIVLKLKEISAPGDVVVFMSNGSFDEIQQKFIDLI
jgi:UDP-N-acetylmuramate: L-alanyl-gamma-D-glutamyl-meso-diaminopimelate ligase